MLEVLRASPRWLVLLGGFSAIAVTTVAYVPHEGVEDAEDASCIICKAAQQPLQELSADNELVPPPGDRSTTPRLERSLEARRHVESACPRAPPV